MKSSLLGNEQWLYWKGWVVKKYGKWLRNTLGGKRVIEGKKEWTRSREIRARGIYMQGRHFYRKREGNYLNRRGEIWKRKVGPRCIFIMSESFKMKNYLHHQLFQKIRDLTPSSPFLPCLSLWQLHASESLHHLDCGLGFQHDKWVGI